MPYFLVLRTPPNVVLALDELLALRDEIHERTGVFDVHRLPGPAEADIDAYTLAAMIAEGRFAESDFAAFCDSIHTPIRRPDGEYDHLASQRFLELKRGQEIMSFSLPTDDSAPAVYAAMVRFALERGFRLCCPLPPVQGDLDLTAPGHLPPDWDRYKDDSLGETSNSILAEIQPYLSDEDDPALWEAALRTACNDISTEVSESQTKRQVFLIVGPCSSWLRPHQTRWRADDLEFAWPSGYGGVGYSRTGLPELEWCCCFQYDGTDAYTMVDVPHRFKSRQHVLRIAIPTRTVHRRKASINMYWTPGTPRNVRRSVVRIVALSREYAQWNFVDSMVVPGKLWSGELLPPPRKRIHPRGGSSGAPEGKPSPAS